VTPETFQIASNQRFADNELMKIRPAYFRAFAADIRATFVPQVAANVPEYDPNFFYFKEYLVTFNDLFYRTKQEGFLPAPTPGQETAEWKPTLLPLSPVLPYDELPVLQGQVLGQRGQLEPSKLYRFQGRVDAAGDALDDVLVVAVSRYKVSEADAYTLGLDPHTQAERLLPVSYDLATDTTAPRAAGPGGAVDAYTKAEADTLLAAKGDDTVQQQHTLQLATLGVQGSPVYGYLNGGQVVGYATLDEALADPRLKTFLRFNVATVTVTKSNAPSSPNWAYYADGAGATLYLEEGVVLSIGGEDRSSLQMSNFFIYPAPSARNTRVKLLASRNTTRPIGELPFISALCSVPVELSGGAVVLTGYYTVLLGTGTVYAVQPFQCGNVAAGITVVPIGGGGSGASYSKAESDTQLAAKADLDPAGRVPRSQMPRLHDITYNYPAGQTASPEYRIVDFDAAGYYAISHISAGVTVNGYYLNDVLVAPTAGGQFLLATQDKFKINATAPAGSTGTIVFSQLT
jgi:hypothetical protein